MGSIAAPVPNVQPMVSADHIERGLLSEAQLETLIYAANAFERDLAGSFQPVDKGCALTPDADGNRYRCGYFLGDGTGAGKGRQVASAILDRWYRGERRHVHGAEGAAVPVEDADQMHVLKDPAPRD